MSIQYDMSVATSHARMRSLQLLGYIGPAARAPCVALWLARRDGRRRAERELGSLSDAVLKDIGVARSEISWIARTRSTPFRGSRDRQG
jgi:uncharacterized protein YjiS (DUF1127 family)